MKSKSPFAMKSPLLAYKSDMTGNYANPEYVPRVNVGAAVGAHVAKTAADVFSSINEADKAKQKAATDKASGGSNDNRQTVNVYGSNGGSGSNVHKGSDTDITTTTKNILGSNQGNTGNSYAKSYSGLSKDEGGNAKATGDFKGGNLTDWTNYVKDYNSKKNSTTETTRNEVKTTWTMNDKGEKIDGPVTMKGSPVKHNAGAVGSIGNADPLAGGIAGIGQQISNQAQQRAAKLYTSRASNGPTVEAAGGMIGVTGSIGQDVLPPPNQVAETGSYGGSGDRMLEMDSNPVGNQSIGRNTDVASQLFGSGQRASMLAMKGTPLHTKGHGGAEGHTHAEPGEYLDQTVAENKNVFDIENYKPIQKFKGGQIVVNSKKNDTIFSTNSTFEIPKAMEGITQSTEGTPKYKPVYINKKSN